MYSEKYSLYFIDECHEKNYENLLKDFPQAKEYGDYRCAIYIVALPEIYKKIGGKTGRYPFVWVNAVEEVETIKFDEETYSFYDLRTLREKENGSADFSDDAYYALSSSYQSLVQLGEELYGNVYKGFEIMDVIADFDDKLYKVFMQVLKIRRSK